MSRQATSHEYTDKLVSLFSKQLGKQRSLLRTPDNQKYQDKLFYTLSEIKSQADLAAVADAAKFAIEHLGGNGNLNNDTLYSRLKADEINDFANFTPQQLFDIYNNEIAFI